MYLFKYFLCSTVCHTVKPWDIEMIKHGLGRSPSGNVEKGVWMGRYRAAHLGPCMSYSGFLVFPHRAREPLRILNCVTSDLNFIKDTQKA